MLKEYVEKQIVFLYKNKKGYYVLKIENDIFLLLKVMEIYIISICKKVLRFQGEILNEFFYQQNV